MVRAWWWFFLRAVVQVHVDDGLYRVKGFSGALSYNHHCRCWGSSVDIVNASCAGVYVSVFY